MRQRGTNLLTTPMGSVKQRHSRSSLRIQLFKNQDALICLFDQGIVSVAGFATSILIGRIAPTELGIYYIALSIVLFVRGFQEQMISIPYTIYHHRQRRQALAAYRGSCVLQQTCLVAIVLVFLAILTIVSWNGWVSAEVVPALVVLMLFTPVLLMREVVRQYCFTHMKNLSAMAVDSTITVLQIGALLVLGYLGLLSGAVAWGVIGMSCLIALGYWYWRCGPVVQFQRSRIKDDWKQNWSFGKWATAGQLVGSLPGYTIPWILAAAAGTEGTGYFAAGMTLVGVANILNTGMANYLTPKAANVYVQEGAAGLQKIMIRMSSLFLVVIGSFVLVLSIVGGWLAVQLYDSSYAGLGFALTLLAIAKLFDSFAIVASNGLFVMERMKANFWADVILMVVTITAAVALVYPYGMIGAVWTTVIGSGTSAILRFVLLVTFLNQEHKVAAK